jgi:hypothetical protein
MTTHPTFARAALGGFVGTLAMTAMMYFVAPMMGLNMDIAAMLGSMLGGSWTAGMMMQVVVMPMMGAGVFSSAMGGMMAAMGSLVGHVLYGSLLGIVAGARDARGARA